MTRSQLYWLPVVTTINISFTHSTGHLRKSHSKPKCEGSDRLERTGRPNLVDLRGTGPTEDASVLSRPGRWPGTSLYDPDERHAGL